MGSDSSIGGLSGFCGIAHHTAVPAELCILLLALSAKTRPELVRRPAVPRRGVSHPDFKNTPLVRPPSKRPCHSFLARKPAARMKPSRPGAHVERERYIRTYKDMAASRLKPVNHFFNFFDVAFGFAAPKKDAIDFMPFLFT